MSGSFVERHCGSGLLNETAELDRPPDADCPRKPGSSIVAATLSAIS
jgi:hypothetical protein